MPTGHAVRRCRVQGRSLLLAPSSLHLAPTCHKFIITSNGDLPERIVFCGGAALRYARSTCYRSALHGNPHVRVRRAASANQNGFASLARHADTSVQDVTPGDMAPAGWQRRRLVAPDTATCVFPCEPQPGHFFLFLFAACLHPFSLSILRTSQET